MAVLTTSSWLRVMTEFSHREISLPLPVVSLRSFSELIHVVIPPGKPNTQMLFSQSWHPSDPKHSLFVKHPSPRLFVLPILYLLEQQYPLMQVIQPSVAPVQWQSEVYWVLHFVLGTKVAIGTHMPLTQLYDPSVALRQSKSSLQELPRWGRDITHLFCPKLQTEVPSRAPAQWSSEK